MSEPALRLTEQPYSETIINSARHGDQEAMRELYDTTKNYAWYMAKRYLQNDSDVEDVLQEVYCSAFSKLDTFEDGKPFKPWLLRIVSNKCIDSIRKNKHVFVSEDEIGELATESEDVIPVEWLERTEKQRDIVKIIDKLPNSQRTAVTLFYLDNLPISQIAEVMGVTNGTVKYNLHHGRNRIKEQVLQEERLGNKLYSLAPIPPLAQLFSMEAELAVMSEIAASAIWAGTVSSLSAGGIISIASSVGATIKVGLGAKFMALSAGMKAVAVAATVAVTGTIVGVPAYLITANMPPAYAETFESDANTREEIITPEDESGKIARSGPVTGKVEDQAPTSEQSAPMAVETSTQSAEAQESTTSEEHTTEAPTTVTSTTKAPTTETSTTEAPTAETSTTEAPTTRAPTTRAPVTEALVLEPPTTEPPVTEPPTTEQPVTEPPTTGAPATRAPTTIEPVTEEPTTKATTTEESTTKTTTTEETTTKVTTTEETTTKTTTTEATTTKTTTEATTTKTTTEAPVVVPPPASGNSYNISSYYNSDGTFSSLGLSLDDRNSEKVLTVRSGDVIAVGPKQYTVVVSSLTLSFYPQPSLDEVIKWWTSYLDNLASDGRVY
ncbi:MAG: sigma-70 family RNA polymerase sigma factor [Oscillospiraceae bacterium]|nr:sigma-70 family RNA polymerase sigma factor [Oscillospiraceae bacterium]